MSVVGFVLDWQKKLGYREDPFIERPKKKIIEFLVDREEERERLNLFVIKQERFGIIQGVRGSGKTTLLNWLSQQLRFSFFTLKVVRISGKPVTSSKLFFKTLLDAALNPIEKTMTKPHEKLKKDELTPFLLQKLRKKRVLIIIDDAQLLAKENRHLLQDILHTCPGGQVLLALERVLKEHESYGKDELKVVLEDMPTAALRDLIQKRIELVGGYLTHPFDKDELNKLVVRSKKNPVRLLTIARDRAIELSIKAGPPPKPPKPETKHVEKMQQSLTGMKSAAGKLVQKSIKIETGNSGGRFSIKFVDEEPPEPPTRRWKKEKKEKKKEKKEELDESILTSSTAADAELLGEIVTNAEESVEDEEDNSIEVEDVIQSLVEELDENKR
ncbi:ATP-binding protein [Candidatus Woesearchaeota archaeon]|nr:ATP-binding protein [Candidatus Woesearchaeota archaeon]